MLSGTTQGLSIHRSAWRNCLKSLADAKTKALEAYETGQSGLISLRFASDFHPRDTTERLFRQFLEGEFYEVRTFEELRATRMGEPRKRGRTKHPLPAPSRCGR